MPITNDTNIANKNEFEIALNIEFNFRIFFFVKSGIKVAP